MNKFKTLMIAYTVVIPGFLQSQDSEQMKTKAFQVGLFTPLSTNGLDSWNCNNNFSLNILGGYAGGVDGVEFSSLVSVLKTDMVGAQFTGLGNIVLRDLKGTQFSGLYNIVDGEVKAAQFAGLINVNCSKTKGFQASGLINLSVDSLTGLQVTGLLNYSKGFKATQISGLTNVNSVNLKGAQIAGLTNINAGRLSGVQIAGLFNYTKMLNGTQIGTINYVDSLESGVPIGFLSFVRHGYMSFEISSTETMYGVASFKTGIRQFYNILSVGWGYRDGMSLFGWGYGIGTLIPAGNKVDIGIEGLCYQVNEGEWFTNRLNLLNKLNFTVAWNVSRHFTLFVGPSWNVAVSDVWDEVGEPIEAHIAPWSVFDETTDNGYNIKMYPGFIAGVRF